MIRLRLRELRSYLSAVLSEAAIDASTAQSQGLALFAGGNSMVLYSPKKFAEIINANDSSDVSSETGAIVGFIHLAPGSANSCNGAAEVAASAAVKGYGPLMYDVAMSKSSAPLMPDRSSLSPKAAAIWQYYDNKRSDVKKLPLDDIDDPKTPDERDDCAVWDCDKYGGKPNDVDSGWDDDAPSQCSVNKAYTGAKVDVSGLVANHEKFVSSLEDGKTFVRTLPQAARSFFDEKAA